MLTIAPAGIDPAVGGHNLSVNCPAFILNRDTHGSLVTQEWVAAHSVGNIEILVGFGDFVSEEFE